MYDEFGEAVEWPHWRGRGEVDIEELEDKPCERWSDIAAVDLHIMPRETGDGRGTRRSWHGSCVAMEQSIFKCGTATE
jgi:hypothetical protein